MFKKLYSIIVFFLCFSLNSVAQKQTIKPDLSNRNHFRVTNREITVSANDPQKIVVHLNAKPNDGAAWLNNVQFGKGIIEFDVKGKNMMQQSFLGIAFHGLNGSTYDAVYFRPFNFQSPDSTRRNHSVQYISLPSYHWQVLREKFPGKYENKLTNSIDPESWFHVKVMVADEIAVYVNNHLHPSLIVKQLNTRSIGNIGFWVGNNSDADFANLVIHNH